MGVNLFVKYKTPPKASRLRAGRPRTRDSTSTRVEILLFVGVQAGCGGPSNLSSNGYAVSPPQLLGRGDSVYEQRIELHCSKKASH
jgi:hypothetical protein